MPIFLRTYATDSNPAGASEFVAFSVPVGVRDGDIIVVGLAINDVDITVTPPDDWTKIEQTDDTIAMGIVAFWKLALSEPVSWVFALSDSIETVGGAFVYGNTDFSAPIEVSAAALTASSATHSVAALTASVDGQELLLLLGADDVGTYTPATGFIQSASKSNLITLAGHRKQLPQAGAVAAFTVTFSTPAAGASLLIALRPAVGKLSLDEVRQRLIEALPQGVDDVYDLTPAGDFYKYFGAIAALLKVYGFDLIDLLQREVLPSTAYIKLSDWERIFGLETSRISRGGTIPQRQAQVVAAWRRAAGEGSSIPEVQAAVAPLLGYTDNDDLEILECSRPDLLAAHTYTGSGMGAIPASGGGSITVTWSILDDAFVSAAGARIDLVMTHASVEDLTVTLANPGAQATATWAAGSLGSGSAGSDRVVWTQVHAGLNILGTWTMTITSSGAAGTLTNALLFVEGIGRDSIGNDGLGAAAFEWGPFIDPTKTNGGLGGAVDYKAVRLVVESMSQSHTLGTIIRGSATVNAGQALAIPDDSSCIPNEVIPN